MLNCGACDAAVGAVGEDILVGAEAFAVVGICVELTFLKLARPPAITPAAAIAPNGGGYAPNALVAPI